MFFGTLGNASALGASTRLRAAMMISRRSDIGKRRARSRNRAGCASSNRSRSYWNSSRSSSCSRCRSNSSAGVFLQQTGGFELILKARRKRVVRWRGADFREMLSDVSNTCVAERGRVAMVSTQKQRGGCMRAEQGRSHGFDLSEHVRQLSANRLLLQ